MVTATPHEDVEAHYGQGRRDEAEHVAMMEVTQARMALTSAIEAFEAAGYGSHVTNPLRDALRAVEFSISEVKS